MIYVSFTTVPDRMSAQEIYTSFLNGLLQQDTKEAYKIIINVPLNYKNYDSAEIPEWLVQFIAQHRDKFIVLRDEIDYGPIVNLLYPLKHLKLEPEDIIIVCDDDHLYHQSMISYHLKKLQQYPENHSICFRGNRPMEFRMWTDENNTLANFYHTHVYFPTKHDIYLQFPDHWHSVSYRRKFLQDDIFDQEFLSMTWNNDTLMAYYAWTHNFYFLCANYEHENDWRPVNQDGRSANSFPITQMLPVLGESGCNRYRVDPSQSQEIWNNKRFADGMKEKAPFSINTVPNQTIKETVENFTIQEKFSENTIMKAETSNKKVIVTLSTVPKRLLAKSNGENVGIQPGLQTILEQTNVDYEVHLNIPYTYQYKKINLPTWLVEWQKKYTHLKVFRTFDFGPITKIYPTIQRTSDPDTIIITVDDDLFYNDGFITAHLEARKNYPGCALGFAGITSIEDNVVGRYHFASTLPEDVRVRMLEGYKTISYERRFFTEEFDEFAFSHWADDVAISAYLGYKNIKKIALKCESCTDFTPRVESFPVIGHVPMETAGCNVFRQNEEVVRSSDIVANEWYKLGYLER